MYCKTCEYIRSHRYGNDVNVALLRGDPISSIMLKTGLSRKTLTKHRDEHHMSKSFLPQAIHTKAAKEQLDLMKCVTEIYADCKQNAGKAKRVATSSREFRDASGCWDPATKALGLIAKSDGSNGANNDTSLLDAIKASAKVAFSDENDKMETTKPQTNQDNGMVDTS